MLALKSVDAGYGTFQALFGVDLEVKAGEAVGVIGPNGAGKTTLMRVISGLIRPTRGSITMEGTDVVATAAHRIVSLGIAHVPENRRLFPRLTVDDNLKMGAYMPGARARYAERLEFVFDLFPHKWTDPDYLPHLRTYEGPFVKAVTDDPDEFVRDKFKLYHHLKKSGS